MSSDQVDELGLAIVRVLAAEAELKAARKALREAEVGRAASLRVVTALPLAPLSKGR